MTLYLGMITKLNCKVYFDILAMKKSPDKLLKRLLLKGHYLFYESLTL